MRRLVVARSELAAGEVAQQLRPAFFRVADHRRIGVLHHFLGHERGVDAADDDGDPARAEVRRQLVRAGRGSGDRADADQVGLRIRIDVVDSLIHQHDLRIELRRNERRERRQRERLVPQRLLPNAGLVAIQRSARRDEENAHVR